MKRCFSALFSLAILFAGMFPIAFASGSSLYISTVMKFSDFSKETLPIFSKKKSGDGSQKVTLRLPCILVYDPAGVLIYYGSDPAANGNFLNHLPESAAGHGQVDGPFQRSEIFTAIPNFAKSKDDIESNHRYLVFAITQSPSHPMCLPQDSAVRALSQRTGANKIDVLQIALDMRG